jgi:hypothetical protein
VDRGSATEDVVGLAAGSSLGVSIGPVDGAAGEQAGIKKVKIKKKISTGFIATPHSNKV